MFLRVCSRAVWRGFPYKGLGETSGPPSPIWPNERGDVDASWGRRGVGLRDVVCTSFLRCRLCPQQRKSAWLNEIDAMSQQFEVESARVGAFDRLLNAFLRRRQALADVRNETRDVLDSLRGELVDVLAGFKQNHAEQYRARSLLASSP